MNSIIDFLRIICLRKYEVSVDRILVCNVIEINGGTWHTVSAILRNL